MRNIVWQVPRRRRGHQLVQATFKLNPAFLLALRQYAEQETERTGKIISQSTILTTLALEGDARLRRLYKSLIQSWHQ